MFKGEGPKGGVFSNLSAVSVSGNNRLCGGPLTSKLSKSGLTKDRNRSVSGRMVLAISLLISTFLLLVVTALTVVYRSKKWKRETAIPSLNENCHPKLSYAELSQAAGGFLRTT